MATIKIALCQISVRLKDYPFMLEHPIKHRERVEECIDLALSEKAQIIVFPEYNLNSAIIDYLKSYSRGVFIIGGSYISPKNTNRTVLVFDGNTDHYDKINLSPYEESVVGNSIESGNSKIINANYSNISTAILTCQDYYVEARHKLEENPRIEMLLCPALNNNSKVFLVEAEALHQRMPEKYSIYCNAAGLWVDGQQESKVAGGSFVFGPHDPNDRAQVINSGLALNEFDNNIFFMGAGERIGFMEIEVPYTRISRASMNYTHNPKNVYCIDL